MSGAAMAGLGSGHIGRTTPLAGHARGLGASRRVSTSEDRSAWIAAIAARGRRDPASLTGKEIRDVCGAAPTQAADRR